MRRKYLIVATDTKGTAPGIVFNVLVRALSSLSDCVLVTADADSSDFPENVEIVRCPKYVPYSWNSAKMRWRQFHFSPKDAKWWRLSYYSVIKQLRGKTFDIVLSFTSMGYYPTIQLGRKLSEKFSAKWAIYSVDGIPSPLGWVDDAKVYNIMSSFLDWQCRKSNAFFSSNPFMMEYERNVLKHFRGNWDFVYTPWIHDGIKLSSASHHDPVFLYAGSIYGLRKIDGLLSGFRKYISDYPKSKMVFVGDIPEKLFSSDMDLLHTGHIEVHPYTSDLSEYYERATVLVDIAADIPNDIFLSSKIVSYLLYNRPIMAISGENSPVRKIFADMVSICHCYNDSEGIYNCMRIITECNNFDDRATFIEIFSAETSARKMVCQLDTLFVK